MLVSKMQATVKAVVYKQHNMLYMALHKMFYLQRY